MDNITHGLLGLAIGALRRPDGGPGTGAKFSPTDRAVLFASLLAAELPDLDSFWPEPNAVLHALRAHRGISHALVIAPVWAGLATLVACLIFRRSRAGPTYGFALLSVLTAHILADLWTGWGTRVLLPFSDTRYALDFAGVVDPFFTLPLLVGLAWALARRWQWRRALVWGLLVSFGYLGFRVASREVLFHRLEARYPGASEVEVFPSLLSATTWRFVVGDDGAYLVGRAPIIGDIHEQRRVPKTKELPQRFRGNVTIQEAVEWARLPLVSVEPLPGGGERVWVADLRYNIGGEPTLSIVVDLGPDGETVDARLDRGGSAKEIAKRWRESK